VIELGKQRSGSSVRSVDPSQSQQVLVYRVTDTQDEATAAGLIAATIPATITLGGITLYPYTLTMTREGATAWIGEYLFKSFQYPAVGEIEIEFDTDGGTAKVTQAVSHLGDYAPSGVTAPNFGGLINVTPEGVEGFDAEIPAFNFIYHATFTSASLTQSYSLAVAGITKTVNSATWHGFAAGTVFFGGLAGRVKRGADQTTLSYKFRFEPIDAARTDANSISLPDRSAFDPLWYSQTREIDTSSGRLVRKSASAHIDRVYGFSDFSALALGSSPWP
jgi:hypothetical protein